MSRILLGSLMLSLAISATSLAQERRPGLLGVHIEPKGIVKLPEAISKQLPEFAIPRLAVETKLSRSGELIVEYETDDEGPTIAVFKRNRLVARFGVSAMTKEEAAAHGYTFIDAAIANVTPSERLFVAAYSNSGDGAGTLFQILTWTGRRYRIAFERSTLQGRVKILKDGRLRFWDATWGDECFWCAHIYRIQLFVWRNHRFTAIKTYRSRTRLSPYRINARPIIIE